MTMCRSQSWVTQRKLRACPQIFLQTPLSIQSCGSAKERRVVNRLVLNSFQTVYFRPTQGLGGRAQDGTEAYGLVVLETRAFLRALQSWGGQRLGKDAGGAGEGKDLWHFPCSWKQRQIPVSCMSNPVPPS